MSTLDPNQLLILAQTYSEATGLTLGTVGKRACGGNHHFFNRLAKGRGANSLSIARVTEWFAANWPDNAEWPKWIPGKPALGERPINAIIHPIKIYRIKHNLSLLALAKRAQTTQATLSRIEAGLLKPSFDLLARLANAMEGEVSTDAIIYQEKRMLGQPPGSALFEVTSVHDHPDKLRLRIDCVVDWRLALQIVQMIGEAVNTSRTNVTNALTNGDKQGPK